VRRRDKFRDQTDEKGRHEVQKENTSWRRGEAGTDRCRADSRPIDVKQPDSINEKSVIRTRCTSEAKRKEKKITPKFLEEN